MWRPSVRRSNVWVSTAQVHEELMEVVELRPVQDLPGGSHPFQRLVTLLVRGEYCAAGIDAPFALPARHTFNGDRMWTSKASPSGCQSLALRDILTASGRTSVGSGDGGCEDQRPDRHPFTPGTITPLHVRHPSNRSLRVAGLPDVQPRYAEAVVLAEEYRIERGRRHVVLPRQRRKTKRQPVSIPRQAWRGEYTGYLTHQHVCTASLVAI